MQKDLFGGAVPAAVVSNQSESKMDFLQKVTLNLRLDQAIIAALGLVVVYVLVFSFGVESGKRFAMAEIKAERTMRERMARELGEKIFSNTAAATKNSSVSSAVLPDPLAKLGTPEKSLELPTVKKNTPTSQPAKSLSAGKFAIQTVTFTSKSFAEKHLKLLSSKGYQGLIISKGKFHQVCVAGFENKEKALLMMKQLKRQGLAPKDAYIRPLAQSHF